MNHRPSTVEQLRAIVAIQEVAAGHCHTTIEALLGNAKSHLPTLLARRAALLAAYRLPSDPTFATLGEAFGRCTSSARVSVRTAMRHERQSDRFARLVARVSRADAPASPLPLAGVPCVTASCSGRMIPPPFLPDGRRQCPLCDRYEPKGLAARRVA